jgi:type IV pilus assembly protein PilA
VLKAMSKRIEDRDEGFTLIELMVVVLIIAILIAIAIPTFLGARKRANDRAAQSELRNALTAEKTYFTDNQQYTSVTAQLDVIEPSLSWNPGTAAPAPSASTNSVNVDVHNATSATDFTAVCVYAYSKSGTNFEIKDIPVDGGATPVVGTFYYRSDSGAALTTGCQAAGAAGGSTSW